MNEKRKDLILGLIANYDFETLRPFLETLHKTGYAGDIVFFYANINAKTLNKLQQLGVACIPFNEAFPYVGEPFAIHNAWKNEDRIHNLAVYCLRYLLAHEYLAEYGHKYRYVMLTDTRDVIFQKDPFAFPIRGLSCFMEREGATIASSPVNAQWIEEGFGKEELIRLANKPIICSGITIGPVNNVRAYLRIFLDCIIAHNVPAEKRGMDQGIHNYLVHEGTLPDAQVFHNTDGPVLTLGLEDIIRLNVTGQIINTSNQVPNVVHQYDRHWNIAKRYWSKRFIWHKRYMYLRGKLLAFLIKHVAPIS